MNRKKLSKARVFYLILIYTAVAFITITCMVPIINLLATSFSSSQAIIENRVGLLPVEFTTKAYTFVLSNREFWTSFGVSLKRVLIGVPLNVLMIVLVGYPLSKSEYVFPARKYYVAFMLTVMLFNGGMMPSYFIVAKTGLIDTIWALVFPGAVPIFSCIVLMNFFRGIPGELEESARLDGANQLDILVKIYLPLSKPSLATVTLFSLVGHWNAWFDAMLFIRKRDLYPLQIILREILIANSTDSMMAGSGMSSDVEAIGESIKYATIVIATAPILCVYPFIQKYFTKGVMLGAVKG